MPPRDSQWSYVHMTHPHHVLYQEKWIKDKLPYDDIDFHGILLQQQQKLQFQNVNFLKNGILIDDEDDDELNVPINQTQFGASRSHKKLLTNNTWKDLDLKNFLDESADKEIFQDSTILKHIDQSVYKSDAGVVDQEPVTSATSSPSIPILNEDRREEIPEFVVQDESGDTVMQNSDASTTPLMTRTNKRDFYQTPIGRILR